MARRSLASVMRSSTPAQRAQLSLLNGMHGAPVLLALATAYGDVRMEDYARAMTQGWSADSPQEQDFRAEAAYIGLFGKLAALGE